MASALCHDPEIFNFFGRVCFVALGQNPEIRAVQVRVCVLHGLGGFWSGG